MDLHAKENCRKQQKLFFPHPHDFYLSEIFGLIGQIKTDCLSSLISASYSQYIVTNHDKYPCHVIIIILMTMS